MGALVVVRGGRYPFNLVKTQIQSSQAQTRSPLRAMGAIVRREGFLSLYKVRRASSENYKLAALHCSPPECAQGFGTSLLGLPLGPVYISTLEMCRSMYTQLDRQYVGLPSYMAPGVVAMFAGGSAAAVAQLLGVPIDIVSQHRMLQQRVDPVSGTFAHRASPWEIFRRLVRAEGIRGMYRGYGVSVLTYGPSSAMMWGTHAAYSEVLDGVLPKTTARHGDDEDPAGLVDDPFEDPQLSRDLGIAALAGGCAGVTTAYTTNGMDLIRTRLQTETKVKTVRTVVQELVAVHGPVKWWLRGASARAMAMGPTSMMIMTMYQLLKRAALKPPEEDSASDKAH